MTILKRRKVTLLPYYYEELADRRLFLNEELLREKSLAISKQNESAQRKKTISAMYLYIEKQVRALVAYEEETYNSSAHSNKGAANYGSS